VNDCSGHGTCGSGMSIPPSGPGECSCGEDWAVSGKGDCSVPVTLLENHVTQNVKDLAVGEWVYFRSVEPIRACSLIFNFECLQARP
jgi:hypothetical protein